MCATPIPEDGGDDATVEQIRKKAKWDNDDYVCRSLILNGMSDSLFYIYQNVESSKELWNSLEAKYMADDAIQSWNLKKDCKGGKVGNKANGSGIMNRMFSGEIYRDRSIREQIDKINECAWILHHPHSSSSSNGRSEKKPSFYQFYEEYYSNMRTWLHAQRVRKDEC
ncbi:hypothetical protein Tco_0568988 [Tanacetum coccineum]